MALERKRRQSNKIACRYKTVQYPYSAIGVCNQFFLFFIKITSISMPYSKVNFSAVFIHHLLPAPDLLKKVTSIRNLPLLEKQTMSLSVILPPLSFKLHARRQ